ncbi:MAG: hypothetical protein AAB365_03310 [Patescibacteria group bacterium]
MKKVLPIILVFILLGAGAYWYFFMRTSTDTATPDGGQTPSGFTPFGRTPTGNGEPSTPTTQVPSGSTTTPVTAVKLPALRLLSTTPIGGYGASTTATTTVVRWIDRGRGNIIEAHGDKLDLLTISNTVVPRVYSSIWNKNLTAFIGSSFLDNTSQTSTVYADIRLRPVPKVATSTASSTLPTVPAVQSLTPYELAGKGLPDNLIAYAASPKKDKLFMLINESGTGVGYVSSFDGKSITQIFTTPITQVNVEWPEEKTIAITTKGTASEGGFLYFVDPKSGIWRKIAGPVIGISTKVSTDAKRVLISSGGKTLSSNLYTIADGTTVDAIVRTMSDKCVWGNFYKEMVYCAAPSQPIVGSYPDDWYKGSVSFVDKIWQINGATGEIKLISSIVDKSDRVIDAFNLGLDEKDDFLFFMNKNDLTLWSLDLVSSN